MRRSYLMFSLPAAIVLLEVVAVLAAKKCVYKVGQEDYQDFCALQPNETACVKLKATCEFKEAAAAEVAKYVFGAMRAPSTDPAEPHGSYARGCLSGAIKLPETGPGWQAMRLSRNRNWGHPEMIEFIERLSRGALRCNRLLFAHESRKVRTLVSGVACL